MPRKDGPHSELRWTAETRLASRAQNLQTLASADVAGLVHELQVHQIELEMQNEALRDAQAEVIRSRDRYAELYDAAPMGYVTLDEQGKIREANLEASALLGVERSRLIGHWLQRFLCPQDADAFSLLCRQLVQPGDRQTCELKIDRDGTVLHLHLHCVLAQAGEGDGRSVRVALMDMTALNEARNKRRVLERKLEQTQRLESLGVLAGGVAHDFNNLLVTIVAHASLLADQLPRTSPLQMHVKQIRTAAARSTDLCRQMLSYSGKGNPEKCFFDLSEVVGEMGELLKSAASRNVEFEFQLGNNLPAIEGDVTSVRQIVMNLIVNASEAIGIDDGKVCVTNGRIQIRRDDPAGSWLDGTPAAGEYVFLKVVDTGCGMDARTKSEIFNPFFTTKFSGRGLGLAAVLGMIRNHGGAIEVLSQPGAGTTMRVLLPASQTMAPQQDDVPAARIIGQLRRTILIVDDEKTVRDSMRAVLGTHGCNVLSAADGHEAVELLQQHAGDVALVLLDLTMRGPSTTATCESLQKLAPDLPVVLMSGLSQEDPLSQCATSNIIGFLQKPCSDILMEIERLLQRKSEPSERQDC